MNHMFAFHKSKPNDFRRSLIKLLSYLRPYYVRMTVILLLSTMGTGFAIFSPKILGKATTKIAEGISDKTEGFIGTGIDFNYIKYILIIILILYILSFILNYLQGFLTSGVVQKATYQIRKDIAYKINKLPLRYFDKSTHGDLLSRLTNDVDNVSRNLGSIFTSLLAAFVTLIGIFVMMLTISPTMTLIAALTVPTSAIMMAMIIKRSQRHFENHQKYLGEVNGYVEEMYSAHDVVKTFNGEKDGVNRFVAMSEKLHEATWKSYFISGIMTPMINVISNIGYAAVCILGGFYAINGTIQIGDIQAFIQYLRQFNNPIKQISSIMSSIQSTVAASERIFEFLGEHEEIEDIGNAFSIDKIDGNVDFDKVEFEYEKDTPVIKGFTFKIKAGQKVAIVGPTGAGKTTLVNLLMRFYDVSSGSIKVDGMDIRNLKRRDLRNIFGMVLQDTWLFKGTIRDNIVYGKLDASEEEIVAASKAAYVDEFIHTMPEGYDTVINEEGSNISIGQKQLITIARSLIANPAILILDEATSSVDTRTEILIGKAMKNLMKDRTSFIIAHRLSTIKDADLILVVNNGHIVEHGNHEELIEQQGFYASLYYSQFEKIEAPIPI